MYNIFILILPNTQQCLQTNYSFTYTNFRKYSRHTCTNTKYWNTCIDLLPKNLSKQKLHTFKVYVFKQEKKTQDMTRFFLMWIGSGSLSI